VEIERYELVGLPVTLDGGPRERHVEFLPPLSHAEIHSDANEPYVIEIIPS
jgi:hypothetical protein